MNVLGLPSGSDNSLLQAGSGISYNAQTGTITNSGVLSLTGTTNQINLNAYTGDITLSLPQSIAKTSTPQFNGLYFYNGSSNQHNLQLNGTALDLNLGSSRLFNIKNVANNSIFTVQENGGITCSQPIYLNDAITLNFGNSNDFQLSHDGYTTNNILTGAGRDLVFKSETTSAFNYKFQDHAGTDLFKITGAGVISIPSFSTANRILSTTGTSGQLAASLAYDTANTASAIVQRASDGGISVGNITTAGGVSTFNTGYATNQIVLNQSTSTNRLNMYFNHSNNRDLEFGIRGSSDDFDNYCWSSNLGYGGTSGWVFLCDKNLTFKTYQIEPINDNSTSLGSSTRKYSVVYSGTATINTSDQRAKEQITDSALGLSFVNQLRPVSYKFKDYTSQSAPDRDGNTSTINHTFIRTHYGLIAQEVKTVMDGLNITSNQFAGYIYDAASDTYGLRYSEFISPMMKAIQELSARLVIAENKLIAHNIT